MLVVVVVPCSHPHHTLSASFNCITHSDLSFLTCLVLHSASCFLLLVIVYPSFIGSCRKGIISRVSLTYIQSPLLLLVLFYIMLTLCVFQQCIGYLKSLIEHGCVQCVCGYESSLCILCVQVAVSTKVLWMGVCLSDLDMHVVN